MTILESIQTYHRIMCAICQSYFELSATNYIKFEAVRMMIEIGWTASYGEVMCPTCEAHWQEELKEK